MTFLKKLTPFTLPFLLVACGNDDIDPTDRYIPETYEFRSLTDPSAVSSIEYKDVITRHILINELDNLIGSQYLQTVGVTLGKDAVMELLNRIYKIGTKDQPNNLVSVNLYSEQGEATPINGTPLLSGLPLLQTTYADLSPNINLQDSMPGIAYELPYKNEINTDFGELVGWRKNEVVDENLLADTLIQNWFEEIATLASDDDDATRFIRSTFDYKTLIVQFLSATLFYPKVATFHLNEQHGLLSSNTNTNQPYTELQHEWDLAFGYYGFSRDAKAIGINQIAKQADNDSNSDGTIDLYAEYNFPLAQQAALKDTQATFADTNYSTKTLQAYLTGRQLIDLHFTDNTEIENFRAQINVQASDVLINWENSQIATLVQYVNSAALSTKFIEVPLFESLYATNWANLKALSTSLQFNSNSQLSSEDIVELSNHIGDAPIFNKTQIANHLKSLYSARTLLQTRFNLSEENMNVW